MQALGITTLSKMGNHHTSQHLHVNLAGTDTRDAYMKLYDETKLLYIETQSSGVGLDATLLQIRISTTCLKDEAPDNSILRPIAFAKKA